VKEEEFARALAEALGPLYRVSVVGPKGEVVASFGQLWSDRTTRTEIPYPRSSRRLVLEVDAGSVEAARRVVEGLAPRRESDHIPAGAFTNVHNALDELIALAEAQIGRPLSQMSRADKQQVVRILDERGAFALRKSVETVADALGVSRFTVYNYLDNARRG
jgi:hypothetical protein